MTGDMSEQLAEVTADEVRGLLRGHAPSAITLHFVAIDDVQWPVKQVVSIATGLPVSEFTSSTARRWLVKRGFSTHRLDTEAAVASVAPRPTRTPRRALNDAELAGLEVVQHTTMAISFMWRRAGRVTLTAEGRLVFPPLPKRPGLYRFDLECDPDGVTVAYIGESIDLEKRARNYRSALADGARSKKTSRRIHKELLTHLGRGGTITQSIVTEAHDGIGSVVDLGRKSARLLVENVAITEARVTGRTRLLNIDSIRAEGDL